MLETMFYESAHVKCKNEKLLNIRRFYNEHEDVRGI